MAYCDGRGSRAWHALIEDPQRLAGAEALGGTRPRHRRYRVPGDVIVTGIVDLTRGPGPARLLDVVAGRSASILVSWASWRRQDAM